MLKMKLMLENNLKLDKKQLVSSEKCTYPRGLVRLTHSVFE